MSALRALLTSLERTGDVSFAWTCEFAPDGDVAGAIRRAWDRKERGELFRDQHRTRMRIAYRCGVVEAWLRERDYSKYLVDYVTEALTRRATERA